MILEVVAIVYAIGLFLFFLLTAECIYDILGLVMMVFLITGLLLRNCDPVVFCAYIAILGIGVIDLCIVLWDMTQNRTRISSSYKLRLSWLLGSPLLTDKQKAFRANMFIVVGGLFLISVGIAGLFYPDSLLAVIKKDKP